VFGQLIISSQNRRSLDILVLEEATLFGPVIALGSPRNRTPFYGAARGYFSDCDWRDNVVALARESQKIILCVDDTEGVLWELNHVLQSGQISKALFLMHPRTKEPGLNRCLWQTVVGRLRACVDLELDWKGMTCLEGQVLGFFLVSNNMLQVGVSSKFTEASYLVMTRWFLRTNLIGSQ
jgi:hypothetical protein